MDLKVANKNILSQLKYLVDNLNDAEYSTPIKLLSNASIGNHVRHILEFYMCMMDGFSTGVVNYDKRSRNPQLESSPVYATSRILILNRFIDGVTNIDIDLKFDLDLENQKIRIVHTNIDRELYSLLDHTTHHMALIKIGLSQVAPAIKLPRGFGVAVSTLRYQRTIQKA